MRRVVASIRLPRRLGKLRYPVLFRLGNSGRLDETMQENRRGSSDNEHAMGYRRIARVSGLSWRQVGFLRIARSGVAVMLERGEMRFVITCKSKTVS